MAQRADNALVHATNVSDLAVGKAVSLSPPQGRRIEFAGISDPTGDLVQQQDLVDEPRINPRCCVDLVNGGAGTQGLLHILETTVVRGARRLEKCVLVPDGSGPGKDRFWFLQ